MKHASENKLNALTSALAGAIGISLLIIPARLHIIDDSTSIWMIVFVGLLSYTASLSLQVVSVLHAPQRRKLFIQGAVTFFLLIFTGLFLRAGYFIEGFILLHTTVVYVILLLAPFINNHLAKLDLQKISITLTGLASGIFLLTAGDQYIPASIVLFKTPLAVIFFSATFFGLSAFLLPAFKFTPMLFRLQAIPWLIWCAVFTPELSAAHIIPPFLFAMSILFDGVLPWHRLNVNENNILGQRVVMITATIEMAALVFLTTLLIIIDKSRGSNPDSWFTTRDAAFLFFSAISAMIYYTLIIMLVTINRLIDELSETEPREQEADPPTNFIFARLNSHMARYIRPFMQIQEKVHFRLSAQTDQINALSHQLKNEKKRNTQLILLMELSQQLENQLDQPVASQLAANTLERAMDCSLASIYVHEADKKEFMLLASAGAQTVFIPSGFRQDSSIGAIGRAVRQRKTQIINDIHKDVDYILFENESNLSALIIPLISNGHVNGAIVINSEKPNAFSSIDISLAEAVAAELTRAWERSGYHQRLMNLVQAGSQLSAMVEPDTTAREVASIARDILQARFTFVQIQLGQERNFTQSASSGDAPRLKESLKDTVVSESLIQLALHAIQPFRVRDVRKYASTSHLGIDHAGLRSMLAIPIRWHRMSIGTILAFGKQNEVFFNENDQSLAELLAIQAAGAFESTWLQQELRGSLRTTSLLYRLSNQIIQAENLESAALDIVQTAHKLSKSSITGIVLLDQEGSVAAEMMIDGSGVSSGIHPMDIINDAMSSGQLIYLSQGQAVMRACLPIQTPIRKYGAVWMDIPEDQGHKPTANPNDLQALVNQTAIALERSVLLVESQRQAKEIKAAYDMLESTYDQTLAALMSALDARDRETEGHSLRVSNLAARLGQALKFSHEQLKVLERGSLLHDIGKIGISDTILHKPGPLNEDEWKIMRLHPDIGARIVEGIPFLQDTIPLIRHHQERWDGTGYPAGLAGEEIPILARMFSIVDAFDALTSNRPYRQKISYLEAVEYLHEQAGILFDPEIVEIFKKLIVGNRPEFLEENENT